MAARPEAPADRHAALLERVIPPIAITGMETARQTSFRRSIPCGAPNAAFEGVAKTGPKKNVVGAPTCCRFRSCRRVAGNANEKILPLATRIHTPPYFLNWQTVLTEMHAAGALRER